MRFATLLFLPFLLFAAAEATPFRCNATATAKCQSLIGYVSRNDSTFAKVSSLFQIPLASILGANNRSLTTPPTESISANSTTRIPIPCSCANGNGTSAGIPVYSVQPEDTLDNIARYTFDQFVTYQEIATASGVPDPNKITVGQRLNIPLPCSCDPVGGVPTVHLAHIVAPGSSVGAIASEFGTTQETLMSLNGISDPKSLQAYQILDVPLRACSSYISNTSVDGNLLLPNGSYTVTANGCIRCSCSSSSYQLDCQLNPGDRPSLCPFSNCAIGTGGATSGCEQTKCVYTGYTNSTGVRILTDTVTQNICGSPPPPNSTPTPSGSHAYRVGLPASLLVLCNLALLCFSFL